MTYEEWYRMYHPGLNPDPDSPWHAYDNRAAYEAGEKPMGHGSSLYKYPWSPERYVFTQQGLLDTLYGKTDKQPHAMRFNPLLEAIRNYNPYGVYGH